jgi:cobalt-zinc-cadmium efflux system membrane fusion protein
LKAAGAGLPAAGQPIQKGQPVFHLLPLLTPEGRANLEAALAEVEGQYKTAEAQCAACRIFLDRAIRVFQSEAGSQRAVDEAQANLNLALKTCEAAKVRRDLLARTVKDAEDGNASSVTIESPESGILRRLSALPGQQVAVGGALFEVVNLDRVWVRVPVYVGDLKEIDGQAPAGVGDLAMRPGQVTRPGQPVPAPPTADASAGTVDLYYEDRPLSPGERVGISLTLTGDAASLTVPWSAVIHDIHGGTWVYQELSERVFARQRVEVRYVVNGTAVLAAGPRHGTRVVIAGAAELFGTETGFTK